MVVAVTEMNKPSLKVSVSVSDSDSSSVEESEESENEVEMKAEDSKADEESESSGDANDSDGGSSGNENDSDSGLSGEENDSDSGLLMTNEGWADSVSKILGASKPKNKKTLVLSRAKKFSEVVKKEVEEKPAFEVIGDSKEEKPQVKKEEKEPSEPVPKKKKQEKSSIRMKPNILEKDRERLLTKIATKGVVQLFNAVRNQQKTLEKEMGDDMPESKKEKIMKKFDKRTFLDTLMGQTKSVVVDEAKSLKNELKAEDDKPRWSALRDDFMMGAKMKDWDKESVDE